MDVTYKLIFAAINFIVIGFLGLFLPDSSGAETFGEWTTVCDPGCSTYTTSKVKRYPDSTDPHLIMLEIDEHNDLVISSLYTEKMHKEVMTTNPPIVLRRSEKRYVADSYFFNKNFSAAVEVDGKKVAELSVADGAHLITDSTTKLLTTFRAGQKATLVGDGFCGSPNCKDAREKARRLADIPLNKELTFEETKNLPNVKPRIDFSLIGFKAAYEARNSDVAAIAGPESTENPAAVVAKVLPGNKYGIEKAHLHVSDNTAGAGKFVYVPKVTITSYDRHFVWFVKGNKAVALNGPTITATPKLPRPLDMGFDFWRSTGLDPEDVTSRALDTIFGE